MKIVPLAEVKSKLSEYLTLCQAEPIIITRNGRPSAMLVPYEEDDNLVSLLIANNARFRQKLEDAAKSIEKTGGLSHEEVWARVNAMYDQPAATTRRVAQRKAAYRTRRSRKKQP